MQHILLNLFKRKMFFSLVDRSDLLKAIKRYTPQQPDKDFANQATVPIIKKLYKFSEDRQNDYWRFSGDACEFFYREILKIPKRTEPYFTIDPGYVKDPKPEYEWHVTESGQLF